MGRQHRWWSSSSGGAAAEQNRKGKGRLGSLLLSIPACLPLSPTHPTQVVHTYNLATRPRVCYDHTMQNGPPLIRTAKSICIGLHQYWVEGSPGNTECRSAFCPAAFLGEVGEQLAFPGGGGCTAHRCRLQGQVESQEVAGFCVVVFYPSPCFSGAAAAACMA